MTPHHAARRTRAGGVVLPPLLTVPPARTNREHFAIGVLRALLGDCARTVRCQAVVRGIRRRRRQAHAAWKRPWHTDSKHPPKSWRSTRDVPRRRWERLHRRVCRSER